MWPWGHIAVGYLLYTLWAYRRRGGNQRPLAVLAVIVGTQFPDIVDKPLAWTVPILPSGRSLAHSLLTATLIIALVYRLGQRVGRPDTAIAFAIGYLSHSISDLGPEVIGGLLQGDVSQLQWMTYLVWPLLSVPSYPSDDSFLAHFAAFSLDTYVAVQFSLFALAIAVWIGHGAPGIIAIRTMIRRGTSDID